MYIQVDLSRGARAKVQFGRGYDDDDGASGLDYNDVIVLGSCRGEEGAIRLEDSRGIVGQVPPSQSQSAQVASEQIPVARAASGHDSTEVILRSGSPTINHSNGEFSPCRRTGSWRGAQGTESAPGSEFASCDESLL